MRQETNYGFPRPPQGGIIRPNEGLLLPQSASEKLAEGMSLLIECIDEKREVKKDGRIFVMIAGGTNAGKSEVVAAQLQKHFEESLSVLKMDCYYKGQKYIDEMKEKGIEINRDHPWYLDFDLLIKDLLDLAQGKTIHLPKFNYRTSERSGFETDPFPLKDLPNGIIVVEGNFALRDELKDFGDVKAFVEVSLFGSIMRKAPRDVVRSGRSPSQSLIDYLSFIGKMHQEHVAPTKKNADLVIVNEYNPLTEAEKNGPPDVRVKFRVDKNKMKELLMKNREELPTRAYQHDVYFIVEDGEAGNSGILARIREDEGKYYFTCDGPVTGEMETRPNNGLEIDKATFDLIFNKYIKKESRIAIAKRREGYWYDGVFLNLDTVVKTLGKREEMQVGLGDFIEIKTEGLPDEAKVKSICKKLGLDYDKRITDSYIDM